MATSINQIIEKRAERRRMTLNEIKELLKVKKWTAIRLAAELDVGEATVYSWITERRNPGGPAAILMKTWLTLAKGQPCECPACGTEFEGQTASKGQGMATAS
jgi:hypothetical protein